MPGNYRPISLTSVPCKILEHIICRHVMSHLEKNKILTNLNHGFRSGYSTETQLLTTTTDLLNSFDNGKQVEGKIPAMSQEKYLTPQKEGRKIRSTRTASHLYTNNPVENYVRNNNRCFVVPRCNTEQAKHSFFPRTIIAWNHLDNNTVHSETTEAFKTALAKARRH